MKALEACAAFIASALRKHFNETGFNGLSWQQLVALAAEQGLKPKTMRLGRAHLRDKLKQLILYRSKMPGSRDTRYLWALAEFPLPENSEVISHDPEEEVCTFIAAVKAGVRTLSPSDGGAMQPGMPMQMYSSAAGMGRRLSDGSTGSMLGYQPSLSPRDSTPDNCQDGGNPSSRRRFIPYCELEKQFGVGVSKAAANLGICKTTLKRICRQHGIKQWPRRQIAKALSHLSGHEQGSSSEGTATVPSLMPTPSDTCMPLTLADAGPLNLSLLSASSSLNHGMPQPFTSNYEPLGLSIRTSHMQGAPSTIDAMGRPTNVLTLTGRPTGMQGGGLLGTRSFSDDLSWSSSASPHAGQLQMQGALPQLSLGAAGGLGSSGPGNAGLPWVQLHQLGNQLGMSCPVYVMLPNRGM